MMEIQKRQQKQVTATCPKQEQPSSNPSPAVSHTIVEKLVKINGEEATKVYEKVSFLGKGGFAECFITRQKDTGRQAATKIIPKKMLDSHRTKLRLANEIKIHKYLHHENVVEFYNNFEDDDNVYISLEICENGSLNDILRSRYTFTTPEVQSFVYGICQGLKYLHSKNIIHRDLKLGNLFMDEKMRVKIGDFGLACKLQFDRQHKRTVCGTPNYIAPEVLLGKGYHFQVDIWAVGVMIYSLFFSIPPFETAEPHTTYIKIKKCQYEFPRHHDAPLEAIDLIEKILNPNPANRLTLDEILQHPFMKLGGPIPLGLPPSSTKRAPTKKELQNWPSLKSKHDEPHKQEINEGSSMNKTVLGFFGLAKKKSMEAADGNQMTKYEAMSRMQTVKNMDDLRRSEQGQQSATFGKTFEQVQNQLFQFYLNNGNFGIYDIASQVSYTCQLKNEKGIQFVRKVSLNNHEHAQSQIAINDCPYKIRLNIKQKQLLSDKKQVCIDKEPNKNSTIAKINVYKDVIMARFTDKTLQIVFREKDGFTISRNRKTINYFYSFADLEKGKQVLLSNLINSESCGDKQNKTSVSAQVIASIFKSKPEKNMLTLRKISYLKSIIGESSQKGSQKSA